MTGRPITRVDRHDFPGHVDALVAGPATITENAVGGVEDSVGEPVVAPDLPDIFHRVELE